MPTIGSFSGKLVKLYRGDDTLPTQLFPAVACLKSNNINFSANTIQEACKDSGSWDEKDVDSKGGTVDLELLIKYDAAVGVDEIWADFNLSTKRNWKISTGVTGDPQWNFVGICSTYNETFEVGSIATATATLEITGVPTRDLVP